MKHCVLCLRDLPLFNGLARAEFSHVCLKASKKRLAKGDTLFHQGDENGAVYLVKTGKLKLVQVVAAGRELILDVVGSGDVLGETALFQQQEQAFSAIALEDTGVCCFDRRQFELLIQQHPEFAVKIIGYLGRKLYEATQQVGEVTGTSVREKLLRLLARLADQHGRACAGSTLIDIEITQQELADMVGASRVMVANSLRSLYDEGIISRHGRKYALKTDPCLTKHFH